MKKNKHLFYVIVMLLICFGMSIPLLFGLSPKQAKSDYKYTILDSGMFTQEVDVGSVHTLNCYRIKDYDNYVAIAWGEDANSAPEAITIPSTFISSKPTGSDVEYRVVAVARAGFSRCKSVSISLPQTVVDIREEAFAYCQNLATFIIPKDVEIISPSTFLDCRSLTRVYYSNDEGKKTMYNSKITYFGDHAFDSCVSLKKLQCPSTAVFFGQSCFQKCAKLSVFRFPVDNGETGNDRNLITVEDYAFADCISLQRVYFDINMHSISNYAFADCKSDLMFYFYDVESKFPNSLSALWRNKKITFGTEIIDDETIDYGTLVYDITYGVEKPVEGNYPNLEVSLSNAERRLDNARTNPTSVVIIPGGGDQYAIIDRFNTPDEDDWDPDYYEDGVLTIPEEVMVKNVRYPVKVIGPNAFENNDDIREVHFNSQLVQICNKAFWHSNNIEVLDFEDCESLKEISYSIFNDIQTKAGTENDAIEGDVKVDETKDESNCNSVLTSLAFPNSLEYIGNFAFYNFKALTKGLSFKTNPNLSSQLKIIGDYAFAVYSSSKDNKNYLPEGTIAEMDVELPRSLDDSYAPSANIYHSYSFDRKGGGGSAYATVNKSIWNRVAINKNAFDHQLGLRSITMETGGTAHNISFGSNVFVRNTSILRFVASENLCLMGTETFKACSNLREVFLHADRAKNNKMACTNAGVLNGEAVTNPWGVGDGTNNRSQNIFHTDEFYHLVIYVKRSGSGNYPNSNGAWQGISQYSDAKKAYKSEDIGNGRRKNIPLYTVDWTVSGNIKYWHINDAGTDILEHNEVVNIDKGPKTQADYNNGYISFVKEGDNYTVAKYFTKGDDGNYAKTIDLTDSKLSGMNITKIGHEAFGGDGVRGYYFILPSSVTTIEERAFFRRNATEGVRIVTFKTSNTIQTFSGANKTFEQIVAANNSAATVEDIIGYCCLPKSVTRIERVSFYNNYFDHVELGTSLSFMGNAAFYSNVSVSSNQSFTFTDYDSSTSSDSNSYFETYNGGIYHKGKKMLLHQASGINGALTIKSGTTYIGYRSAAGGKYTSVTFADATQRIYGYAFKNCENLTSISNISNLKSIGTSDGYQADNNRYDKEDGDNNTNDSGAFEGCKKLKVDFSLMTSLQKIGAYSFNGCTKLVTDLGLKEYSIYGYSAGANPGEGTETEKEGNPQNKVLDLSTLTGLTNIEGNSFVGVDTSYVFLPNTTGATYDVESKLFCKSSMFNSTAKVLCGETAQQADQSGTSSLRPTSHYPTGCMGKYTNVYYRIHSASDIITSGAATTRRYWTAIKTGNSNKVQVILFESRELAEDWLSNPSNPGRQCHQFPETVSP